MRPTSVARWGNRTCAAGGRNSKSGFTEAVEKIEGQGTPKLFSGTARRREAISTEVASLKSYPRNTRIPKAFAFGIFYLSIRIDIYALGVIGMNLLKFITK